ncbi:MAG: flagellar protein FlaG [Sulfuricella sp.]|nr:flagellar protein FlaG [Sulfuricella sp.]
MISQISNSVNMAQVNAAQNAPPVDVRQQKTAELPNQSVKPAEAATASAKGAVSGEVDIATAKNSAEQINKVLQQLNTSIQFSVDDDTKANVVKVIDKDTKEVIRQIPTKQMLEIAQALDNLQGLLLKDKA